MPTSSKDLRHSAADVSSAMKIGLFGGTFDPPHLAHLAVAESARSFVKLDKVIWMPASEPPHRERRPFASSPQRLEMTRLAIDGNDQFVLSDIELQRDGKSYTVDTLRQVKGLYPQDDLYLIVGGDSLRSFHTWREPAAILELARLIAFARDRNQYTDVHPEVLKHTTVLPETPLLAVSSSKVRKTIAAGRSIRYLVPDAVAEYIRTNHLYRPDE